MKDLVRGERIERRAGAPIGPYTHGVVSSGSRLLWIAGQIAWDAEGRLVGKDDFEAQYRHIMRSIEAVVLDAGGEMRNLCKLVNYVTFRLEKGDPAYKTLASVRREFVPDDSPAVSTLVQVEGLMDPHALVEVDAIAVL